MLPAPPLFRSNLLPHAALLLAMVAWSSSFIALKVALSVYTPMQVMAARMLVASLVCLPLRKQVATALRDPIARRLLLICVLCEPCFYFLFESNALIYTSAGQASMVMALLPLSVAFGAFVLFRERMRAQTWVGFFLAIFGVVLLSVGAISTKSAPRPVLGNALEVLAVICASGYTLSIQKLADRIHPMALTAVMSFAGALFFVPLSLLPLSAEPLALAEPWPAWAAGLAIVYLGGVVTFLGYGLYNVGVKQLSAAQGAAYINLIPIITLLMGMLWLNEVVAPLQYVACATIIVGIVLSQSAGKRA